jgi:hypothetical protein
MATSLNSSTLDEIRDSLSSSATFPLTSLGQLNSQSDCQPNDHLIIKVTGSIRISF